jgi:hypothetical protein
VDRILDLIARDIKKETENKSERGSGLMQYWEMMKVRGREGALSRINAEKIAGYREQLRDQTLNTTVHIYELSNFIYSHIVAGGGRHTTAS